MNKVIVDSDLEDLIPMFMENRFKDIEEMKSCLLGMDIERIQFISHSLKGVGGGYGFDEITNIGRELEQSAKNSDQKLIKELIEKLEEYLKNVIITFEDIN